MAKKVFLIYPPTQLINREDRCQVPTKDVVIAPPLPPMDLMYLAAIAETAGCECRIKDYSLDNRTMEDFKKDIKGFGPDVLLISVTTQTLTRDLEVCLAAKEHLPGIVTVAKGAHFLKFNDEVLKAHPYVDIIIRGEPEITFKEIVLGTPQEKIDGITWRSRDGVINNTGRKFLEDLDALPFPARHLVDNLRYRRPDNGRPQATVKVSRGCPYDCFFCLATAVAGPRVRKRSYKNILDEIRVCIETYNIRNFLLWSDLFNLDKDWVMGLCAAIRASGLKFGWAANTRVDTIDLEMASAMRKAGCTLVSVGIESGNEMILEKIGKKIDLEDIKKAFRAFRKAGLKTFAYYIIGFPWDTRQTVEDTIRLSIALDSDYANFFTATAFPGTRFFDYAAEQNLFDTKDIGALYRDTYYYPTVKGHYLDREEIVRLHNEAVKRFYVRPRYVLKRLVGVRSARELLNYFRAGIALMKDR